MPRVKSREELVLQKLQVPQVFLHPGSLGVCTHPHPLRGDQAVGGKNSVEALSQGIRVLVLGAAGSTLVVPLLLLGWA